MTDWIVKIGDIDGELILINFRLYLSKKSDAKKNMDHFVKIFFQAKDIEEVRLSSIFRKYLNSIPSPLLFSTGDLLM